MKLNTSFLSQEERKVIHEESLRILAKVGINYASDKALAILEKEGAKVDWDTKIAKIPSEMVEKALEATPKSFVLGARNSEFNWAMPSAYTGYTLDGTGSYVIDFETGERRLAGEQDEINSLRIIEELELVVTPWPPLTQHDVESKVENLYRWMNSFSATSKHIQNEILNPKEVPYFIEILKLVLGSEEAIKERKIGSCVYCTVPPLTHDREMLDAVMELTKYHVPLLIFPMVCPGSTGPGSLHSSIAVANAESLSSIVIFQLVSPGTPLIFGNANAPIDFNSGLFLQGAPEMCLMTGALADMGRYYNLPNEATGIHSDAKEIGSHSVMEKVSTCLPLVMGGVDVISGLGEFDTSMTLSFEQIIVDHEIAKVCKRIKEGVEISPEKSLFEDIAKVGPGGHFLKTKAVRAASRNKEFWRPEVLERSSYDSWIKLEQPDLYSRAHERVKQILKSEPKNPLPNDTLKAFKEIKEEITRKFYEE